MGIPDTAVPHNDVASTVLPFRYRAFRGCVVERGVFDMHGQAFGFWIERRPLGYRPAFDGTVEL